MIKFMFAGHHEPIDIVHFLFNAYFAIYTNASEKVSSYVPGHDITELTKHLKTIKTKKFQSRRFVIRLAAAMWT